jgi:hypothetical protein
LFGSAVSSTQELPHADKPALHRTPQAPFEHEALPAPLAGGGHTFPQVPQLFTSLVSSTQELPHAVNPPVPHPATHAPMLQETRPPVGAVHTFPHAPQFDTSLCSSKQELPLHRVKLVAHAMLQAPALQVAMPFVAGPGQAVPHAPQWPTSACRSTQRFPHAVNCGPWQRTPHAPPVHVGSPLAVTGHAVPQPPQLARSLVSSTHAPRHVEYPGSHPVPHTPDVHVACP